MTLCKNGHERRPDTVDKHRRCLKCLSEYQASYRRTKKNPIAGWQPKENSQTSVYFPDVILRVNPKQVSWYEQSRDQMKRLANHKYAVRGPSART